MDSPTEQLARKVAREVLTNTLRVTDGENVTIEAWSESLPWAVPFVVEARRLGAHPLMLYEDEPAFWEALRTGASRAVGAVGDHEWSALERTDAYVFFFGPSEWPRYDTLSDRRTEGVTAYNAEWYRRAAKARVRGARLYLGRTSRLAADRWEVDLRAWRTALLRASLASPQKMRQLAKKVARRLRGGRRAVLTHPNGTELEFRFGSYPVQVDDAVVDEADLRAGNNVASIPGGAVGVALDHTSGRGSIVGNHAVYPSSGPASGIRWSFRRGRLVDHSYAKGGKAFEKEYRAAPSKGRDRLSYLSVGLNPDLRGCPQLEDQEEGAVLLRLGGNGFAGGENPSPFGTWTVVTGANLVIDGRALLRGGKIV